MLTPSCENDEHHLLTSQILKMNLQLEGGSITCSFRCAYLVGQSIFQCHESILSLRFSQRKQKFTEASWVPTIDKCRNCGTPRDDIKSRCHILTRSVSCTNLVLHHTLHFVSVWKMIRQALSRIRQCPNFKPTAKNLSLILLKSVSG